MPNWVANELKVTGDADAVRRFVEVVAGRDQNGDAVSFSLSAIDLTPAEYQNGSSYRDSDEYKALLATHQALATDDERYTFIKANPGFATERMEESLGNPPTDGWYHWRLQHWGTKWDTTADSCPEATVSEDGREVVYDFDTATGGVKPAIATLARQYPELSFDLVTNYDPDGDSTRWRWQDGEKVEGP